jgi:hypothetical protein
VSEFAGPQERLVSDLPSHLRKKELIAKIKEQNPAIMLEDRPPTDDELWEVLLDTKAKLVKDGKPIEGTMWAEINP